MNSSPLWILSLTTAYQHDQTKANCHYQVDQDDEDAQFVQGDEFIHLSQGRLLQFQNVNLPQLHDALLSR
ncbi:MAG TPA: hypothetical protein VL863_08165 [bacterium]|nr:hypothetical protein [bacterium]